MVNKYLFSFLKGHLNSFFLTLFFGICQSASLLGEYYFIAKIIAKVIQQTGEKEAIYFYLLCAGILIFCRVIFDWIEMKCAQKYTHAILFDFRESILLKIMAKTSLTLPPSGKLYHLLDAGIERLNSYYSGYLPQLMKGVLIPLFFLVFVFSSDITSGIIMLVTIFLIPFFMILIGKLTEKISLRQWKIISELSSYLRDVLSGIETLKVLGRSKAQYEKILRYSQSHAKATLKVQRFAFLSALVLELIGTISIAIIAVGLGIRLVNGDMSYEVAFFILLLAPDYYQPMRQLGTFFHASLDAEATSQDLEAFLSGVDDISWHDEIVNDIETIEFRNVSYKYPNAGEYAIENVSFFLSKGETLALIGRSGSGKSTILSLILGECRPEKGEILINGKLISELDKMSYLSLVAYVAQKPFMVNGSIMENALFYSEGKKENFLKSYTHLFQSLPNGLDTAVGQSGITLSGGQTALVALARVFNSNKPLVLLDEPTSEIDLQTEFIFVDSLPRIFEGRLGIVIAHRLSTIKQADKVLLLENGKLMASGTYTEVSNNEAFDRMRGEVHD